MPTDCFHSRPPVVGTLIIPATLDTVRTRKGWTDADMQRLLSYQKGEKRDPAMGVPIVIGKVKRTCTSTECWYVDLWEFGCE